jgi:hypothetical protein
MARNRPNQSTGLSSPSHYQAIEERILSKPSRLSCAAAETLNSDWFAPSDENLKRQ